LTEAERQRAEARRLEEKAAKLDPDYTDRGTDLRDDGTVGPAVGVRHDDHPVDRQDGPYVDRRDDNPTPDGGSAAPDDPRSADRRDEPGPIR
jgi:hypothetical protein